nr:VTT domain-containing protein [Wenzhouxiangella sp. XN79A]
MAVTTCLTLPTATLLSLAGGFLFGALAGTLLSWVGAVTGAVLTFLMIRFIAGERLRGLLLRGRTRPLVELIERDALFYLTILRLVPVAPFFAINAAGATLRVRLPGFALATALGLLPLLAIYASIGAGAESLVELDRIDTSTVLARPELLLPLLGLASLLGFGWAMRRWLQRREAARADLPAPD